MKKTDERLDTFFENQFLKFESRLDSIYSIAENYDKTRQIEPKLRAMRRYIESLLGERDDCCDLLPDALHKAPAFCRRECAGQGPDCGGCDHGGYGPDNYRTFRSNVDAVDYQSDIIEREIDTLVHMAPSKVTVARLKKIQDYVTQMIKRETSA